MLAEFDLLFMWHRSGEFFDRANKQATNFELI